MKRLKIVLTFALIGLAATVWGQDGTIDKGSGWLYFSGVPGTTPNVSCCAEIAMNVLTREAYVWNRDSTEWELLIELTQGLAAPSGDPGAGPKLFLNRDDGLLYRWTGAAWEAYGSGGALADGDYGHIDVSGTGTVMTVDTGVIGPTQLASTAVTPGSYTIAAITVDADGRITAATSGTETNQTIDTFSRSGSIIYLSLSADGQAAKQLNLSVFSQTISLSGDTLCISGTGTCVVLPTGTGAVLFKIENSATDATVGTTNNYHTGKLGIGDFSSDVLGASLHIYNTDATISLSDSTSTDSTATPQLKFFRGHNASLLGRMGYLSTTNTDLYFTNNATAGKLTFQTEGATVGQLLPSGQLLLPEYGDTTFTGTAVKYLAVTDAGNVIEADGGGSSAPSVSSPTVASTTSIDFNSLDRGIFDLDMSGVATTSLLLSNPRNGGEYTFWFDNASNEVVDFPANFLTAGRDTLGARDLAASRLLRFFYDGTNYICEDTIGSASGVTYLDTVLLSGIVAWYNANDIGQADGTPVTTWNDISGNGNHLVQDTSARQPNYETNFVSGEAVVDFDGVDEWMRTLTGSLVLDTINRTFFIVCKSDDAGTSSGIFMFNDGSEETAGTAGQFGLTNEIALRIDGGNRAWTSDLVTGDGWDMLVVQLGTSSTNGTSTSDISLWINGSAATVSSTSVLTLDTDDTFFSVGRKTADFVQVFSFFDGQIAEIIAYNRALTTAERQKIETYLTNKYGAF